MDDAKFDGLARNLSTVRSRRVALRTASAGLIAGLLSGAFVAPEADAATLSSDACSPIGTRCGRRKGKARNAQRRRQPACKTCCSNYTTRNGNGQRRCSCMPDFTSCRRNDQCCSGLCQTIEDHCGCDSDEITDDPIPAGRVCIPGWLYGAGG